MPRYRNKTEMLTDMWQRAHKQRHHMLRSRFILTEHALQRLEERFGITPDAAIDALRYAVAGCWGVRNLSHATTAAFVEGEWHAYAMTWLAGQPATLVLRITDRGERTHLLSVVVGPPHSMTDLDISDWPAR